MKKRHLVIGLISAGALIGGASIGIANQVKANNEIVNINRRLNEDGTSTEEEIKSLKEKIAELMNNTLIKSIVSYSTSVAGIAGFIITLAKYRKYKAINNNEIAELVTKVGSENLTAKYEELETKLVNKLIEEFGDVSSALSEFEKIIILSQNRTTKGQAVLYEYLNKKVTENEKVSEDVKEALEEVKEANQVEIKKEEELKEEINKDYSPIE